MNESVQYTVSSGNVFADLGLPNPEERLAKATLALRISDIVDGRGWSDEQAAHALSMEEPDLAALLDGRLARFSIERLFRVLIALGQAVEIRVSSASSGNQSAGISVRIAETDESGSGVSDGTSGRLPVSS